MAGFDFGIGSGMSEGCVHVMCVPFNICMGIVKKNTQNAMHAGGAMRHPTSSGGHSQPSDPAVLHSKQRPLPLGVSLVGHLYERHFVCTGEI